MSICKYCGLPFAWGNADGKWVPLIPLGEEGEFDRDYQDENGMIRSSHRQVCTLVGGPTVRVSKLSRAVKAAEVINFTDNRKRRPKRRHKQ